MEPLTPSQASWACARVADWLRVKFNHEIINDYRDGQQLRGTWPELFGPRIRQLEPDAWHSALLKRLLEGKEPLPEPPITNYSYPDYDVGEVARFESEGRVFEDYRWRLHCRTCGESSGWYSEITQDAKHTLSHAFAKQHQH